MEPLGAVQADISELGFMKVNMTEQSAR